VKKSLIAAVLLAGLAGPAAAVGNLADISVYDRAENRTLPVYFHEGRYYVAGKPGNEYQVNIRNTQPGDILSVIAVDGVNAVSGETANWSQTGYVLGSGQGYDVRGWRKNLDRIAAFFFTEHQNSYAARTGRPDNVGVIGVAVFRKKAEPEARIDQSPPRELPSSGARDDISNAPSAESSYGSGPGSARSAESSADSMAGARRQPPAQLRSPSLGTGHGRIETSQVTYTSFERATASPEEVVVIRYDTYANLVALGVIRAPRLASPTPFPGQFVPDPR